MQGPASEGYKLHMCQILLILLLRANVNQSYLCIMILRGLGIDHSGANRE